MDKEQRGGIRFWWAKYRRWILALLVIYVLIVIVLIYFAGGPQGEPFRYQIF
jgi:uncharacterized membrane protein